VGGEHGHVDNGFSSTASDTKDAAALVLLVEDNEDNILTVADYLEFKQFHVIVARNGLECLEMVVTAHPDVVLMDIQMPGLDGLEAIRRLRRMPGWAQKPIVALTALAMAGDCERCLAAGASHYMSKPVSLRDLAAVIEACLQHP
jgi:CheY-like chemotaxis protein